MNKMKQILSKQIERIAYTSLNEISTDEELLALTYCCDNMVTDCLYLNELEYCEYSMLSGLLYRIRREIENRMFYNGKDVTEIYSTYTYTHKL